MSSKVNWPRALVWVALALTPIHGFGAADQYGQVTFSGLPVPGATVTAIQHDKKFVTISDQQGVFHFVGLAEGVCTIQVEMVGFAPSTREIKIPEDAMPWALKLLPFEEITRGLPPPLPRAVPAPGAAASTSARAASGQPNQRATSPNGNGGRQQPATPAQGRGFQRAGVTAAAAPPPAAASAAADDTNADAAADGFLINGSVNNGAASPFAQPRAFGTGRPGQRSLYNYMFGSLIGTSAWDARRFSFTGLQAQKDSYNDVHLLGTFGGPVKLPGLRNRANFFVGYQRTADTNATSQSARLPTELERGGDFSASRDAFGRPVQIRDPLTGLPFADNRIPSNRISSQAASLLRYYPLPAFSGANGFNYEAPILNATRQHSIQSRLQQTVGTRDQVSATGAYQQTTGDTTTLFGFEDQTLMSAFDGQVSLFHRIGLTTSFRVNYQYTRVTNETTPYFANRVNVSGEAGIIGNNQDPANWGPPTLTFSSGVERLADASAAFTRSQTHGGSAEMYVNRGRHGFTFGGEIRRHLIDIRTQQNPRGDFAFTGSATGSDVADFLLGRPQTASMAFGNADKYFRAFSSAAYIRDDWRLSPTLTANIGVRWEYEQPIAERFGRLVNLDIANGFGAVTAVVATSPTGALTGQAYPESLVRPDKLGVQPRLAMAWRPVPGSSLVVRAGYGIYRNTNVYQPIATLMAQQPPLSRAFSVATNAVNPLTLANGFTTVSGTALNTFAIDPDFRLGYAHNWQASMQRDLPGSLTMIATYLGTKGSHLIQEFLPNTYPAGAVNPCPACPAGFVYLTSGGRSTRHAGQIQLRRRLRNGFTATVQYTLAKAMDNAAAFSGAALNPSAYAQNWLDLEAEYAPSNFDQRHLVTAQVQYTTGAGITGGTLVDGARGRLLKDWTLTTNLSAGSGQPLTPVYLTSVPGTGSVGSIRASTTGAPADAIDSGYYLNPAAYGPPAAGQWGNAGRNSVAGPATFSLNSGIARTFRVGNRLNFDFRIDATNVLNRVVYNGVSMFVTSPQFGQPNRANTMRKLQSSLRVRF
jgi:hypothetical protein